MTSSITLNGETFTEPTDFENYGFRTAFFNLIRAMLADMGKAMVTTSASSVAVGTGSKSFTLAEDRPFSVGAYVTVTDAANVANNMFGQVTAYNSGTKVLTVDVTVANGSGTIASWNVQLSGTRGATGATGASYTDEQAQDAVGSILTDSATIDFTYSDGANTITAIVIAGSIGTTQLADGGTTLAKLENAAKRSWHCTFIETPANGDYTLADSVPFAGKVHNVRTICSAGTATVTSKINTTALGGTANSASTTAQNQAHTTSNTLAVGDDLVATLSSVSGCANLFIYYELERTA